MTLSRVRMSPASAAILAIIAVVSVALLLSSASGTRAATDLCPALTGATYPATNGPLTITSPGVYNGDGRTINGGASNIIIKASNVTVCNYVLKDAQGAGVKIDLGGYSNIKLGKLTIQNFNASGAGGNAPDGPQYNAGVACWNCNSLTVVDSTITTTKGYGNGIWLKRTNASTAGPDYIAYNTISGGWDGFGTEPEDDTNGGVGNGTIIENNIISNCNDDGIQVEGRVQNVTVRNNTISTCGVGVAVAPVLIGPLTVASNYIHTLRYAPSTAFFCYKLGDRSGSGAPQITFSNNVCKTGSAKNPSGEGAGGFVQTNTGMSYSITATGNCTETGRYVIEMDVPTVAVFNNNKYYTTDSGRFAKWGGNRVNLSGLQALGLEQGSTVGQCTTLPPQGGNTPAPTPTPLPSRTMSHTSATPIQTQAGASVTPEPEPPPREPADFNCDGRVTMADAIRVLNIVSGTRTSWRCSDLVDVDCDGVLSARDALEILIGVSEDGGAEVQGCPFEPS
jgi:parallel beta-helix repeat protein